MSEPHSTNNGALRAVIYARMSTDRQTESIGQQLDWAKSIADRKKLAVVHEPFVDEARRGHNVSKRTGFLNMLRFCQEEARAHRPVDVIVCWSTSRLSRADLHETGYYLWQFRSAGVHKLLTAPDKLTDFNDPGDRLVNGVMTEASDHKFSADLALGVLRGKKNSALAGKPCGGIRPLGYAVEYDYEKRTRRVKGAEKEVRKRVPVRYVVDEAEAELVRLIFSEYLKPGASLRSVSQLLNGRGIPSPGLAKGLHGKGLWTTETVKRILKNPIYLGKIVWNRRQTGVFGCVVDGREVSKSGKRIVITEPRDWIQREGEGLDHPALVSVEDFEKVQLLLAERQKRTAPRRADTFILSGLLRCGHCRGRMTGRTPNGVKTMLCSSYVRFGLENCNYNPIEEGPFALAIARKLKERFTTPAAREAIFKSIERVARGGGQSAEGDIKSARQRLARLEAAIARQSRRIAEEEDDQVVATYRVELKRLLAEKGEAEVVLAAAQQKREDVAGLQDRVDGALALIEEFDALVAAKIDSDPLSVRRVLQSLLDHAELWFDHEVHGKQVFCTFRKALVYIKKGVFPDFILSNLK
jgi:DNA invertase Pin-like site-specific DNA recombinase